MNDLWYDVDHDIVYVHCFTVVEFWVFIFMVCFAYECCKYIIRRILK